MTQRVNRWKRNIDSLIPKPRWWVWAPSDWRSPFLRTDCQVRDAVSFCSLFHSPITLVNVMRWKFIRFIRRANNESMFYGFFFHQHFFNVTTNNHGLFTLAFTSFFVEHFFFVLSPMRARDRDSASFVSFSAILLLRLIFCQIQNKYKKEKCKKKRIARELPHLISEKMNRQTTSKEKEKNFKKSIRINKATVDKGKYINNVIDCGTAA